MNGIKCCLSKGLQPTRQTSCLTVIWLERNKDVPPVSTSDLPTNIRTYTVKRSRWRGVAVTGIKLMEITVAASKRGIFFRTWSLGGGVVEGGVVKIFHLLSKMPLHVCSYRIFLIYLLSLVEYCRSFKSSRSRRGWHSSTFLSHWKTNVWLSNHFLLIKMYL